jgi:threonine dehydratase
VVRNHRAGGTYGHDPYFRIGQEAPLTATTPGELTFEVNRCLVEDVVVVDDHEIAAAMRLLVERMKIVAEPAGALAIAALLAGRWTRSPDASES